MLGIPGQATDHRRADRLGDDVKEYEATVILRVRFAAIDRREAQGRMGKIMGAMRRIAPYAESNHGLLIVTEYESPKCVDNGRRRLG